MSAYLKRLGVPVLDLDHRGHLIETIRELVKLLHTVGQANG